MLSMVFAVVLLSGWNVSAFAGFRPEVHSVGMVPHAPLGVAYAYKKVDGRELHLYVLRPDVGKYSGARPAFVSFHGGSWIAGYPANFNYQAKYLVSRGMVSVEVEYRLLPRDNDTPPIMCIEDAKSAIRWVRAHAAGLGIDRHRIAGAGGSAGGQMVAFAGLMHGFDDPSDDISISARPDAMILFNPAIINGPGHWGYRRLGKDYLQFSPFYHAGRGAPPTIIMSGTDDVIIPPNAVTEFSKKLRSDGVDCQAWLFPQEHHAFFNKQPYKDLALLKADAFLVHLGWLQGRATIPVPALAGNMEPFDADNPRTAEASIPK